jgi:hypothetical protein
MATAGNGQAHFRVHLSDMMAEHVRDLQRQAWQEGRGPSFIVAFRSMTRRLINSPRSLGEPLYRLPALRLQVRHAAIGPLLIDFAVHDRLPLVFIKGVSLLPHEKP